MDRDLARAMPLTYARSFAALGASAREMRFGTFSDEDVALHTDALLAAYAAVGDLIALSGSLRFRADGRCDVSLGVAGPVLVEPRNPVLPPGLLNVLAVEQGRARAMFERVIAWTNARALPDVDLTADFKAFPAYAALEMRERIATLASFFRAKPVEVRVASIEPFSERGEEPGGWIATSLVIGRPSARVSSVLETLITGKNDHASRFDAETKRWRRTAAAIGAELVPCSG